MCIPYGCFTIEDGLTCLLPPIHACLLQSFGVPTHGICCEVLLLLKVVLCALLQLSGERSAMVGHFAGYLHNVFHPSTDEKTLEVAADTMGHLVRVGGPLTADVVEFEVRSSPSNCFLCG